MSLYALGNCKSPITTIPHGLLFKGWKSRLERLELHAIDAALDQLVRTNTGSEIRTSRWLPCAGSPLGHHDWNGSPFMKIREKACNGDRASTCWCFGLFLWEHMLKRPEAWHFMAIDFDDVPMAGTRYYRWPRTKTIEPPCDSPSHVDARISPCAIA